MKGIREDTWFFMSTTSLTVLYNTDLSQDRHADWNSGTYVTASSIHKSDYKKHLHIGALFESWALNQITTIDACQGVRFF